jgi:uncharacterized SAM-binding protein YcdF (DUF218 family)
MDAKSKPARILKILFLLLIGLIIVRALQLFIAFRSPTSAYLVLGGTPIRELFAAELIKKHPDIKTLISGGSEDPCIWLMFDKLNSPKANVWMESCSHNTFENFYYSAPILEKLGASKILLITDESQYERALPMARIILGAHGIWVDLLLVPNCGGEKSKYPLAVDIAVALTWACASQFFRPSCSHVTHLPEVNMKYWYEKGFYCAPQATVGHYQVLQ